MSLTLRSSGDIPNRKGSAHGRDDTGSYVIVDATCSNKLELDSKTTKVPPNGLTANLSMCLKLQKA